MEDKLVAALRARFNSPAEAVAAMGLDASILEESTTMELSQPAAIAKGALLALLSKRMQPGKKPNELALDEILRDVTPANWTPEKRQQVAQRVQRKFTPVLAMDADLGDVPGVLGGLPPNSGTMPKPATDQSPEQIMAWLSANCPPEMLAKMKSDLGIEHVGQPIGAPGGPPPAGPPGPPPPPAANKPAPDADPMAVPPPAAAPAPPGGLPPATDQEEDDEPMDQTAMDAAIAKERQNQRAIFGAVEHVRAKVGNLNIMAFDSADDVYRTALNLLNVKTEGLHETALKPVFEAQPMPGSKTPVPRPQLKLAHDASGGATEVISATQAFPDLLRISRG